MRHVRRNGRYLRVADPEWADPLDGRYAGKRGGRWNPPSTFAVVYLSRDDATARAYVRRKFSGRPYGPEVLNPDEAPALIDIDVPDDDYVDVVTDEGCKDLGLPATYPDDGSGAVVGHPVCQAIGVAAWEVGERGIACRSASALPSPGEELAFFPRDATLLRIVQRRPFAEWFWPRRRIEL